jgi:hypothetical protein
MAFRFEYNGQQYMVTDNGQYGYRVSEDAHRPGAQIFVEDTARVIRRLKAYQDKVFAELKAQATTAEMEAELAAGWAEEMQHDADTAAWEDERHQAWLDEIADQDDFLARTR